MTKPVPDKLGSDASRPARGRPALPRKEQRQRLVAAAGRVLLRSDIESASVKEIVREAGMSSRSFYEHFRSKEEVVIELIEGASRDFLVRIAEVIQEGPRDPGPMVDRLLAAYLELLVPIVALDRKRLGHSTWEHVERLRSEGLGRLLDLVMERLAWARAEGIIPRLPERAAVEMTLLGIEGLTVRYGREGRSEALGQQAPVMRELLLGLVGLTAGPGEAGSQSF